jgi:hypothetical protein
VALFVSGLILAAYSLRLNAVVAVNGVAVSQGWPSYCTALWVDGSIGH